MNRRQFVAVAAGGSLGMTFSAAGADAKPSIIELCWLRMRNTQDSMPQRTNDFLSKIYFPALGRAGAKRVGAFANVIGDGSPSTLLVTEFADAGAWEASGRTIVGDKEFVKTSEAFYSGPLPYVRKEITVLRGFAGMPNVEAPPAREENKTHIFELRTYESSTQRSLAKKVRMFEEGEIAIFRKVGMLPVFFGEALAGANLPQLTYMLAYDDMAARDKAWGAFGAHPEWAKLRSQPGLGDGEIVSNITNSILRPLPFSGLK